MALEEPHVDRDACRAGRDREVDVGGRELKRIDGTERKRYRRRPESRERLGEPGRLRDHEADRDEPPGRVGERLTQLVEVDATDHTEEGEERDDEQHRLEHGAPADSPQLLQLGGVDSELGRCRVAQLVEVDLVPAHRAALPRTEHRELEERQQRDRALVAQRVASSAQRRRRADRLRAGHQSLGVVAVESVGVGRDDRATEVDDGDLQAVRVVAISRDDRNMLGVELSVGDADVVQPVRRLPHLLDDLRVIDVVTEL